MRRWWFPPLVFATAALIYVGPGLLPGHVVVPLDLLRDTGAWKPDPTTRYLVSNSLLSDVVLQFVPWDAATRRLLAHGEMPWVNQFAGEGSALFANPQAALFSPFTWPRLAFGLWGWSVVVLLKLIVAGLGAFWLSRELGARRSLALLSGIVYELSGYMTVWALHPHSNVAAFLPGFAASLIRFTRHGGRRMLALIIVSAAALTAGGHPETLVVGVLGSFVLLVIASGRRDSAALRRARMAILGSLAGFLFLGVQLVPFARLVIESHTYASRIHSAATSCRWVMLVGQVLPGFLGSPLRPELDLSALVAGSGNFSLRNQAFVGFSTIVIVIVGWSGLERKQRWISVVGAVAMLFACEVPVLRLVASMKPLRVVSPEYWGAVFVLCAAAVVGPAFGGLGLCSWRRRVGLGLLFLGFLLVVGGLAPNVPFVEARLTVRIQRMVEALRASGHFQLSSSVYAQRLHHYLTGARVTAFRRLTLPGLAWCCVGVGLSARWLRPRLIVFGLCLELASFGFGFVPVVRKADVPLRPTAVDRIRRADPLGKWRFVAIGDVFPPNLGTLYEARDFLSYDVLEPESEFARWVKDGWRPVLGFSDRLTERQYNDLGMAGVRYFLSRTTLPGLERVDGDPPPAVGVYENVTARSKTASPNQPPAGLAFGFAVSGVGLALAIVLFGRRWHPEQETVLRSGGLSRSPNCPT